MSDTTDDYKSIDPKKLDWKSAQLFATRPDAIRNNRNGKDDNPCSVGVRVIFTEQHNVRWPTQRYSEIINRWVWSQEMVPASGAIVKYPDGSIRGYDRESFAREHEACELIDPKNLDWENAQEYQECHFDLEDNPILGGKVSVIPTNKSVYWCTPSGKEEVAPKFGAILKTEDGQIIGLDKESFRSEYMSSDMLTQMRLNEASKIQPIDFASFLGNSGIQM